MEDIIFFDPHFHIWDLEDKGVHDKTQLFAPHGVADYTYAHYLADSQGDLDVSPACHGGRRVLLGGGAYVEAMSACFPDLPGSELQVEPCLISAMALILCVAVQVPS